MSPPDQPHSDDSWDISDDWDPEDPVFAEMPEASSADFLESRRWRRDHLNGADSVAGASSTTPLPGRHERTSESEIRERASFQSDPQRFLKCLSILETALRLRQKQGVATGQPPTVTDLTRLAMATLQALPIDLKTNADFLVQFVARAVEEAMRSSGTQTDPSAWEDAEPDPKVSLEFPKARGNDVSRVNLPPVAKHVTNTVSGAWGKRPLSFGPGPIKFDEGRAVLEDLQNIPGVGVALIDKDGKFRSRFYRTLWWTSVVVSFVLLGLLLLCLKRWATEEPKGGDEESLVDAALYAAPDLNALEMVLGRFIQAKDWPLQVPLVRLPELMEPKMRRHHAENPYRWGRDYHLIQANLEVIQGVSQVLCLVEMESTQEQRALLVEVTASGDYRVDWEYAELWQEVPWDDFRDRTSSEPEEMLVVLTPGRYFNFGYRDETIYQCWEVIDPAEQGASFFAYARRESIVGQTLSRLLEDRMMRTKQSYFSVILNLRHPEEGDDPLQTEILQVMSESALRVH